MELSTTVMFPVLPSIKSSAAVASLILLVSQLLKECFNKVLTDETYEQYQTQIIQTSLIQYHPSYTLAYIWATKITIKVKS